MTMIEVRWSNTRQMYAVVAQGAIVAYANTEMEAAEMAIFVKWAIL
jgi:hypothetical protein